MWVIHNGVLDFFDEILQIKYLRLGGDETND